MTDNSKLLPLPSGNVAHLIAAQEDEIEALRAEMDALEAENERLRGALVRILENEPPDWKFAEEFGGYVLDDELREEARAALAKAETQKCPSDVNDTTRGS